MPDFFPDWLTLELRVAFDAAWDVLWHGDYETDEDYEPVAEAIWAAGLRVTCEDCHAIHRIYDRAREAGVPFT